MIGITIRSAYYNWLIDPIGKRKWKYMELDQKIKKADFVAKGRNGSPRLTKDLQVGGILVSRLTVARHMTQMGMRSKLLKRFRVTTDFITYTNLGHFNEIVMKTTNFKNPNHGAVTYLTRQELKAIAEH